MKSRSYAALLWTLALLGLAADQASKYAVFRTLASEQLVGTHEVWPGVFRLIAQFTSELTSPDGVVGQLRAWNGPNLPRVNHGALFGLGGNYQKHANAAFAAVSVVAALAIAIWSRRPTTRADGWLCGALGLILAGTLGNLFDRIVFHGVRDFLYFYWFEFPVFNVADCCLVCGAGMLLLQALWTPTPAAQPKAEPALTEAR